MSNPHMRKNQNSSDDEAEGDANQTTSLRTTSSIGLPDGETYEVFLNFRGEDTRTEFTDHLYNRLLDAGVWVFRDNEALPVGEKIEPELVKAIKASKICIPVISPNYAFSEWCLKELVHILECKETIGQVILPIFYKVKPSSIRNQTGTFEDAFCLLEKKYGSNSKVVQEWRNALTKVAYLKGLESLKIANGHEGQLVQIVVTKVLDELRKATLTVPDHLVGIEHHVEKILKKIEGKESNDAQVMVIHGMGGVGKTTLAKVIYNLLSTRFKHCSFLPDIRERLSERKCRPEDLQKQLISDILQRQCPIEVSHTDEGINIIKGRLKGKKVLLLFDDVDHTDQLKPLARDRSWYKFGSILIITTRNKDVLKMWEGRLTYELNELNYYLSFQLFCRHAFQRDECPLEEFYPITKNIISITGGLPLAIEVIGSMLLGKSKVFWEGTFKKLKNILHNDVKKILKISYDSLGYEQQQIFLDIACLPIKEMRDLACYMWDDCGFYPEVEIEELVLRSLLKIEGKKQLIIHDQLRHLGRDIVSEEAQNESSNYSRLSISMEAFKGLQGTARIQALSLPFHSANSEEDYYFANEQFGNLTKLRYLQLNGAHLVGDFENHLSNIRWLEWQNCPAFSLPTNFCPTNLVILDLSYSMITEHWEGWAQVKLVKKLKVLKLDHCYALTATPDFSTFEKLEILSLRCCGNLRRIHPSIYNLNKTLLTVDTSYCLRLKVLPTEMDKMGKLRQLLVDKTSIEETLEDSMTNLEIPSTIGREQVHHLVNSGSAKFQALNLPFRDANFGADHYFTSEQLEHLTKRYPPLDSANPLGYSLNHFSELPSLVEPGLSHIGNTSLCEDFKRTKLIVLNLDHCDSLINIPKLSEFKYLEVLSLKWCGKLRRIHPSICDLTKTLLTLDVSCCFKLKELPTEIGKMEELRELIVDWTSIREIPISEGFMKKLEILSAIGCQKLRHLPNSIGSLVNLVTLRLNSCSSLTMLPKSIGSLKSLTELNLQLTAVKELPNSIQDLQNLERLDISGTPIQRLPATIGKLRNLQHFKAYHLYRLTKIPNEIIEVRSLPLLSFRVSKVQKPAMFSGFSCSWRCC